MKLRTRDMKKFSENLNDVFSLLNELTGSKVFQSSVFDLGDGEDLLHICVCGRDSVWTDKLEVIDRGMGGRNEFISVLKGIESPPSSPLYSHLLPKTFL